ncbi:MAG: oxygenase MpaB family protein [Gulosibacter sp.]|uniref:oxygenase MpaB family protein n=1 Tax=Gulosibacter sp. TaxID=2817531 RepID=UPI003F8E99AA
MNGFPDDSGSAPLELGRNMSAEGIVLCGGGAAILLQLTHPKVAAGVARHSDFDSAPLRRLEGTLDFVTAVVHGTDADRALVRDRVNFVHGFVRGDLDGERYDARDPDLQLWVAATLFVAARDTHARVFGRASHAAEESLLACFASIATELQVPDDRFPATTAEFERWWREELGTKTVGEDARAVFSRLRQPAGASLWLRALTPLVVRVSLSMLPARIRREFAPEWSKLDRFIVELWWAIVLPIYRILPRRVRTVLVTRQLRHLRSTA